MTYRYDTKAFVCDRCSVPTDQDSAHLVWRDEARDICVDCIQAVLDAIDEHDKTVVVPSWMNDADDLTIPVPAVTEAKTLRRVG